MGVALTVVPGIVGCVAVDRRRPGVAGCTRCASCSRAAAAMVLVGGAWPALVELTPAADRPWVSGTSDNRILSLIFEYNGLGRVDGQAGGPGGVGGGNMFGGTTGPLRLLNSRARRPGRLAARLRASSAASASSWRAGCGAPMRAPAGLSRSAGRSSSRRCCSARRAASSTPTTSRCSRRSSPLLVGAGRRAADRRRGERPHRSVRWRSSRAWLPSWRFAADYPGQLTWLAPVLIVVGVLAALALAAFTLAPRASSWPSVRPSRRCCWRPRCGRWTRSDMRPAGRSPRVARPRSTAGGGGRGRWLGGCARAPDRPVGGPAAAAVRQRCAAGALRRPCDRLLRHRRRGGALPAPPGGRRLGFGSAAEPRRGGRVRRRRVRSAIGNGA